MPDRVNPHQFIDNVRTAAASHDGLGPSRISPREYQSLYQQYSTMWMGNIGRADAARVLGGEHPKLIAQLRADFIAQRNGSAQGGYQAFLDRLSPTTMIA